MPPKRNNTRTSRTPERLPASFRDRSGYVFRTAAGTVFRNVAPSYAKEYEALRESGLYDELVEAGLLIPHQEVAAAGRGVYKTLKPLQLEFISYPYEWSFSQLKDAALATLDIQQRALALGLTLKDASAYNIQFHEGRPVLIDTLSFERYEPGAPWVAYRQFCQHFLAPLALMSYTDARLSQLLRVHIDGVPLDLAMKLLPRRARLRPGLALHLTLHARAQQKYDSAPVKRSKPRKVNLAPLVASLSSVVSKLDWKLADTEWGDYYTFTNYTSASFRNKGKLVGQFTRRVKPKTVWDMGGNTGAFSRIASDTGIPTISFDIDDAAIEKNYLEMKRRGETNLLPLFSDLTNPSPGLGWDNRERESLFERGPADLAYFLAIIHHMAIGNNVPLDAVAKTLTHLGRHVILEWVPKTDSKVKHMLASREDIFDDYTQQGLEAALRPHFRTLAAKPIPGSKRILYLLKRK